MVSSRKQELCDSVAEEIREETRAEVIGLACDQAARETASSVGSLGHG